MKLNDGDRISLRIRSAFARFDPDAVTRLLRIIDPDASLSAESLDELSVRLAEPAWSRATVAKLDGAAVAALRLLSRTPSDVDAHELDQAGRLMAPQAEGAPPPSQQLLRNGAALTWPTQYPRRPGEIRIRVLGPLRERWIALASARLDDEHPTLAEGEESFHVQRGEFQLGVALAVLDQMRPRSTRFGDLHRSDLRVAVEKLTALAGSEAGAQELIRKTTTLELMREEDGRLQLRDDTLAQWDDPLARLMLDEVVSRRTSSAWRAGFDELYVSDSWVPKARLLELALLASFEQPRVSHVARVAASTVEELAAMPGMLVRQAGAITYLRLSEPARRVMQGQHSGISGEARLLVQPNMEIVAHPGAPMRLLARLGAFCRLKAADTVAVFALDEPTARRAASEGWTSTSLLRLLEEHATHGVPSTVARALADWVRTRVSATVVTGVIILVDLSLREIRDMATGFEIEQIAPGVFRVPEQDRASVVATLRRAGVACSIGSAPDREELELPRHQDSARVFSELADGARDELNRLLRIPGD